MMYSFHTNNKVFLENYLKHGLRMLYDTFCRSLRLWNAISVVRVACFFFYSYQKEKVVRFFPFSHYNHITMYSYAWTVTAFQWNDIHLTQSGVQFSKANPFQTLHCSANYISCTSQSEYFISRCTQNRNSMNCFKQCSLLIQYIRFLNKATADYFSLKRGRSSDVRARVEALLFSAIRFPHH